MRSGTIRCSGRATANRLPFSTVETCFYSGAVHVFTCSLHVAAESKISQSFVW